MRYEQFRAIFEIKKKEYEDSKVMDVTAEAFLALGGTLATGSVIDTVRPVRVYHDRLCTYCHRLSCGKKLQKQCAHGLRRNEVFPRRRRGEIYEPGK